MTHRFKNVLAAVVDDDPSVLKSLENLLESAGHRVRLFDSASALLESGSLADIDFLISDIDLPKVDGFELLRQANAVRPEIPVILITGHAELENRWPSIGGGRYRLFKKPFNGQELLAAIGDAIRHPLRQLPRA